MDTLYYRKIAELVLRDDAGSAIREAAARALATGRESRARINRSDKRALKAWMRAWCDRVQGRSGV